VLKKLGILSLLGVLLTSGGCADAGILTGLLPQLLLSLISALVGGLVPA